MAIDYENVGGGADIGSVDWWWWWWYCMVELVMVLDGTSLFLGNQYLGEWFNLLMATLPPMELLNPENDTIDAAPAKEISSAAAQVNLDIDVEDC